MTDERLRALAERLRDAMHKHNGVICDSSDKVVFAQAADAILALLDRCHRVEAAEQVVKAARPIGRFARFCHKDDYAFMKLEEAIAAYDAKE